MRTAAPIGGQSVSDPYQRSAFGYEVTGIERDKLHLAAL